MITRKEWVKIVTYLVKIGAVRDYQELVYLNNLRNKLPKRTAVKA
jgi:hypothetical protein